MELGGHGYLCPAHGIVEDGIGDIGQRKTKKLVVAVDAGALGWAGLFWVDRLLVATENVGEGIVVCAREALQLRWMYLVLAKGIVAAVGEC